MAELHQLRFNAGFVSSIALRDAFGDARAVASTLRLRFACFEDLRPIAWCPALIWGELSLLSALLGFGSVEASSRASSEGVWGEAVPGAFWTGAFSRHKDFGSAASHHRAASFSPCSLSFQPVDLP